MCLERDGEANGKIIRTRAVVADAEGQGRRPAPQITIDGVILFLKNSIARLEVVRDARRPVLVHAAKYAAGDKIIAEAISRRVVAEISMSNRPTPSVVGFNRRVVIGQT